MAAKASAKLTPSKIFLWILMGMLFVGLAGFGATNLSGTVRTIGSVGDKDISVDRYARALQQEIRAVEAQTRQPLPFLRAQEMGLDQQVLATLVTARALDHEAARMGLSVGDEEVARQLRDIDAFSGASGEFNRESYRFALQNIGMTEAEFEADLRDESARAILQGAVLAGNTMPQVYVDTLIGFALETRDVTYALLDQGDVQTGLPVPSEDQLSAYYADNIARYTRPEARQITYAWLSPEMLLDTVEVEEDLLRASYEERFDEFNLPGRRLVERLIYADEASAQAAADRITAGESSFEDEVAARGLALEDTDLGDVTREDLGAAGEAVFAAGVGSTVVAPTDLGPALFRINVALPAQQTSFEDARQALRDDLALDRARRVIETLAEEAENMLAGGATLEELAETTEMELGTADWAPGEDAQIMGYEAVRAAVQAATEDDFPTIAELGDGGIFAFRIDAILPPAPYPLDEVRPTVTGDWEAEQLVAALTAQADGLVARLSEGQTFAALALPGTQLATGLTRTGFVAGLPPQAVQAAFAMAPGEARVIPVEDAVVLLQLDAVNAADTGSDDAQALADLLRNQAASDKASDLFRALSADIQTRAGIEINQQAINAVHSNFQ